MNKDNTLAAAMIADAPTFPGDTKHVDHEYPEPVSDITSTYELNKDGLKYVEVMLAGVLMKLGTEDYRSNFDNLISDIEEDLNGGEVSSKTDLIVFDISSHVGAALGYNLDDYDLKHYLAIYVKAHVNHKTTYTTSPTKTLMMTPRSMLQTMKDIGIQATFEILPFVEDMDSYDIAGFINALNIPETPDELIAHGILELAEKLDRLGAKRHREIIENELNIVRTLSADEASKIAKYKQLRNGNQKLYMSYQLSDAGKEFVNEAIQPYLPELNRQGKLLDIQELYDGIIDNSEFLVMMLPRTGTDEYNDGHFDLDMQFDFNINDYLPEKIIEDAKKHEDPLYLYRLREFHLTTEHVIWREVEFKN